MTLNEAEPSTEVEESGPAWLEGQHAAAEGVFGPWKQPDFFRASQLGGKRR
jgi:hypothetical protein